MSELATTRDTFVITEQPLNPLDPFLDYTIKLVTNVRLEISPSGTRRYDDQSLPRQLDAIPGIQYSKLTTGDASSAWMTAVLIIRKPGTDRGRIITDATRVITSYCFPQEQLSQPTPPSNQPGGIWRKLKTALFG